MLKKHIAYTDYNGVNREEDFYFNLMTVNDSNEQEVYFGDYCEKCKHFKKREIEEPCAECLDNPVNISTHKPVKYENK